jgi:hypothetical protein
MPIKRRTAKRREYPITPAAVAAFEAGDWMALHQSLGLRPWHESPLDAEGDAPSWLPQHQLQYWELAKDLRAELEEASHAAQASRR